MYMYIYISHHSKRIQAKFLIVKAIHDFLNIYVKNDEVFDESIIGESPVVNQTSKR